jgi:hypothetical protein
MSKIHLNNVGGYNSYPLAKKSFENDKNTVTYYFTNVNWIIDDFAEGENVKSIPILDSLINVKSFLPETGQKRATALTGVITLKGNIHVDEFAIYEKYKKEFPNIEFRYDIGESGSLNRAVNITFMNLDRNSENNTVCYEVKASGKSTGANLAKLVSDESPSGKKLGIPKKDSTDENSFEFTGYWN